MRWRERDRRRLHFWNAQKQEQYKRVRLRPRLWIFYVLVRVRWGSNEVCELLKVFWNTNILSTAASASTEEWIKPMAGCSCSHSPYHCFYCLYTKYTIKLMWHQQNALIMNNYRGRYTRAILETQKGLKPICFPPNDHILTNPPSNKLLDVISSV